MKEHGLGEKRKEEIFQICHLISEVKEFKYENFREMLGEYKTKDETTFQILSEARDEAEKNYTHYLNAKISGTSGKFWQLTQVPNSGEETVIGKALSEIRERIGNEMEYRQKFLSPKIRQITGQVDKDLERSQRKELFKARTLSLESGKGSSGIGL